MNKRVNFEDNIFILTIRIRMIRDIITLDADPELFLEKTLDDIYFSDKTLRILLEYLQQNTCLVERAELLEQFCELEWQFSQILQNLLDHGGNFCIKSIPGILEKITVCRSNSLYRQRSAETLSPPANISSGEPIVSSHELTELLKAL